MRILFYVALASALLACSAPAAPEAVAQQPEPSSVPPFNPSVMNVLSDCEQEFESISDERKQALRKLGLYVGSKASRGEAADLVFICTHNSRRSHMSQIWAATSAAHYGLSDFVRTHYGGTEETAFNARSVAALRRQGFEIDEAAGGTSTNPVYRVAVAAGQTLDCFSKKYDHEGNPAADFAAVITCSHADKNCPNIPGASLRVAVPYVDPKERDGQPDEAQAYDERARQIATEMVYLMHEAAKARS